MQQHWAEIAITSISIGELLYGVQRLPHGRRRIELSAAIDELIVGAGHLLLTYDEPAARKCADIREAAERNGTPMSVEDAMIAAICQAGEHSLATRNVKDFEALSLRIINPWD